MAESDDALVLRAQQGDRGAWSELCARHAPRLAAYLGGRLRRPQIVDKLVAEVVAGAWKHLVDLQRPGDFPAWFRRVGGNLTLQWCRKHPDEPLGEPFPAERCAGDAALHQRMDDLEGALAALSDAQRMALEQHVRGGMDIEALCEALHLEGPAVQALLDEALLALGRQLGQEPS
jgi:DNA-directed RNA polymerase specialized sigma24 family protein